MYNFSKTLQPLSKTLQPLTTRPKPPPNKRLNKNWGRNLNHLYVSHVAFDLAISFFPYPIKQQKNFLRLATKLANHLDRTSQFTLHCTQASDPLCSAVELRKELVQIILVSILWLIPKLIQSIENGLQAFATRFLLWIFTLVTTQAPWKDRCLAWKRGSETNHLHVLLYMAKTKCPKGLLFLKQG